MHTEDVRLQPSPINVEWLLDGSTPVTVAAEVARTHDCTTTSYLWETTQCRYRWEHASDETIVVLAGEVFLRDEDAASDVERRLGPGDVAFFPAGTRSVWRIPDRLRKVSTLTRPLPRPLAIAMCAARAFKRVANTAASHLRNAGRQTK